MELIEPQGPVAQARALDLAPWLVTRDLAQIVEVHPELSSTNDRAVKLAQSGAAAGLAVVALAQTAGRGQRGRRWHSAPGAGLYVSFLLRPSLSPRLAPAITLVAGVAVHRALTDLTGADLGLRWPNDLLSGLHARIPGRKVGGILVEASGDQMKLDHAVVGIGINLRKAEYPPALADAATSLEALTGQAPDLPQTLATIANHLESALDEVESEGLAPAAHRWTKSALGLGSEVELSDGQTVRRGTHQGIAEDGALCLKTANGIEYIYRGDLSIPGVPKTPRAF